MNKLLEIKKDLPVLKKDSTATIPTKSGGGYSYNYVDINSVLEAVTPVLTKHDCVLIQPIIVVEGRNAIHTQVIDNDGTVIVDSTMLLLEVEDPKEYGAVITYFRRYAIISSLGLESEDDENALPDKPKTFMKDKAVYDEKIHTKVSMPSMEKDQFKETARKFEAMGGGYDGGFFLPHDKAQELKNKKANQYKPSLHSQDDFA